MSTREAVAKAGNARGRAPASRIVRIGRTAAPLLVAMTILATVALAVPHDAWLPRDMRPATSAAWEAEPGSALDAIIAFQVTLGGWAWRSDVVSGAIAVAAACAAAAAALMTSTLRRAGLRAGSPALLALVATAAPFAGWSGSSPLGAAPVMLASVVLLTLLVRHPVTAVDERRGETGATGLLPLVRVAIVLALLTGMGEALSRARQVSTLAATSALLLGDLGPIGLVLLAAGAVTLARATSEARVWLGAGAAWLLTLPFPAEVRAAAVLPWVWWLVGVGVTNVIEWRGGGARWAGVGLMAWLALHVAARPWGHERQQAALVGTWAHAMAERLTETQPLVTDTSPRGRVLSTLVAQRGRGWSASATIAADQAHRATESGRQPVSLTASQLEILRWGGLGFAPWGTGAGASVEDILAALPPGTVTLAVISADAAGRLSPRQWQALGRLGLRLPDAATGRAHALAGITGARIQALEVAQAGSVRLDVQPGDVLGRTAARSPVDARLEADGTRVRLWLRGEVLLDQVEGLALVFFTTRGDMLAWRAGPDPAHLDGPALGTGPATRAVAVAALPCLTVPAGRDVDVTALTGRGALGVTWAAPGRLDLTLDRPREWTPSVVRLAETPSNASGPVLIEHGTRPGAFALQARRSGTAGVYLRGPVARAQARADQEVRLCAAWPMSLARAPGPQPVEVRVAPRVEPHFGMGWHDLEVQPGVGYFRWMSGPRAELLLALPHAEAFTFALDAQAPVAPSPGDEVRLAVGGRDVGTRPLLPTRGIYTWDVPADAVRDGVNTITLGITRMAGPAGGQDGGDARQLGLLVRGWTLGPSAVR
ncbi:hypothetical protein [Luteitalea pratensis]|nr:hypothetical protein [Luteitalea pratensis]